MSSTVSQTQIEQAVQLTIKRIKKWTIQEIENILKIPRPKTEKPIIIPLGNRGYLIGDHALLIENNEWTVIYKYSDNHIKFLEKRAAIFYIICQEMKHTKLATQIYNYDQTLGRLNNKAQWYKTKLLTISRKNVARLDIYQSRYLESVTQIKKQRCVLEKTVKLLNTLTFRNPLL